MRRGEGEERGGEGGGDRACRVWREEAKEERESATSTVSSEEGEGRARQAGMQVGRQAGSEGERRDGGGSPRCPRRQGRGFGGGAHRAIPQVALLGRELAASEGEVREGWVEASRCRQMLQPLARQRENENAWWEVSCTEGGREERGTEGV